MANELPPPKKTRAGGLQMALSYSAHRAAQDIVNAQVCVNRAVFELNRRRRPDEQYLLTFVADAIEDLGKALKLLVRRTKQKSHPPRSGRAQKGN